MQMKWGLAAAVLGLAVAGVALTGCEEVSTDGAMEILPSSPVIGLNAAVELTAIPPGSTPDTSNANYLLVPATNAALPFVWEVSNPELGTIISTGGLSAVYRSSRTPGTNAIKVRDQLNREGVTVVTQYN